MIFERSKVPQSEYTYNEWTAGKYILAELMYTFGQHRIVLWHGFDVVGPQF